MGLSRPMQRSHLGEEIKTVETVGDTYRRGYSPGKDSRLPWQAGIQGGIFPPCFVLGTPRGCRVG